MKNKNAKTFILGLVISMAILIPTHLMQLGVRPHSITIPAAMAKVAAAVFATYWLYTLEPAIERDINELISIFKG